MLYAAAIELQLNRSRVNGEFESWDYPTQYLCTFLEDLGPTAPVAVGVKLCRAKVRYHNPVTNCVE